jgi:hypothetical protein
MAILGVGRLEGVRLLGKLPWELKEHNKSEKQRAKTSSSLSAEGGLSESEANGLKAKRSRNERSEWSKKTNNESINISGFTE